MTEGAFEQDKPSAYCLARKCFFERAAHYRDVDSTLRAKTRFFAAAAWINDLLGQLSSNRILSVDSVSVLHQLGSELLIENIRLATSIGDGDLQMPRHLLDHRLVEHEQDFAARILAAHEQSHPDLCRTACHAIDALLNSRWLHLASALLPAPLRAMGRLAKQQPLRFTNQAHREAIGLSIVRAI